MKNTPKPTQSQFDKKAQAWSARFSEPVSELVKRYTASVDFDKRLARFDIQGSLAHAQMLEAVKVITPQDRSDIERGMMQILTEIDEDRFQWLLDLEDVHLNIEKRLVEEFRPSLQLCRHLSIRYYLHALDPSFECQMG
jgi:argininosuccinate lyase